MGRFRLPPKREVRAPGPQWSEVVRGFFTRGAVRLVRARELAVTTFTSVELTAILVQVIIALLIVRRSYAMTQGVPYSTVRLVVFPGLVLVLWAFDELGSILLTPLALPILIALDSVVLVVTAIGITSVAERMTRVSVEPPGTPSYQISFSLAALFVATFAVRIAVGIALFPTALEFGSPAGGYPPFAQQFALALIDALFSASVGLLVGRSVGIYRKVRSARDRRATRAPAERSASD